MDLPAYFLTWTTYGTWLHGDPRGSIDDAHNRPGTTPLDHDPIRFGTTQSRLAEPPFTLDTRAQSLVENAIRTVATKRAWTIHALNVRSNHVHVVIHAPTHTPEVTAGQLKSWATRALREANFLGSRTHVWTKRASTRWINDHASLEAAIDYVTNHQ